MSRRQARELALQALFQLDINKNGTGAEREADEAFALGAAIGELPKGSGVRPHDIEYAKGLVHGTRGSLPEIDGIIAKFSRDWKIYRMAIVDRNIARLAIYEMRFSDELLTPKIAINEAVELAKKYGSDDSGRFVNGILGDVVKEA